MKKPDFNSKSTWQSYDRLALRTAVIYMLLSAVWIFFSEKLVVGDPQTMTYVSLAKGWFYTIVVAIALYFTISRIIERRNRATLQDKQDLEAAKIGFLSIASHQLRTPLSMTKWVLDSLVYDKNTTPDQKEKFENLIYSNQRLIGLVDDLLSVSEIESGKLKVAKKPVDLRQLIDNLIAALQSLAERNQKNVQVVIPAEVKEVYCDPVLTYEILQNLLSNALLYSPAQTAEIIITLVERPADYLISVHDDGVMDAALIKKISSFDKFVRGDEAAKLEPSGTGLGLYITKKMAEAGGGNIWFESGVKSGTNFYLTIIKDKIKK
jgi:signal transduction histidine kinase